MLRKNFWQDMDGIYNGWYGDELKVRCKCGLTFGQHGMPEENENGIAYSVCPNDKTVFHPTEVINRVPRDIIIARKFNKNLRNLL